MLTMMPILKFPFAIHRDWSDIRFHLSHKLLIWRNSMIAKIVGLEATYCYVSNNQGNCSTKVSIK